MNNHITRRQAIDAVTELNSRIVNENIVSLEEGAYDPVAELLQFIEERTTVLEEGLVDYLYSEGCSCCRHTEAHEAAMDVIAPIMEWPRYDDDSGWDWRTRREKLKGKRS